MQGAKFLPALSVWGKGGRHEKDAAQRVANVSQLTAMPAPLQTAQWRIAGPSEDRATAQGCLARGVARNWLQGPLPVPRQRRESVSLLKIFAREI